MKVYGASVVKGMLYTLKTFFETYIEDFKRMGGKQSEHVNHGLRSFEEGIVTVQYPEEPMPVGSTYERFRVLPMLVYDQLAAGETSEAPSSTRAAQEFSDKNIRCTACGICAKVCPPQCIWIVQESDDKGKPITVPKDFFIDTAVCMNCGMCAEFCPFDAIKMDHKFALNVTEQRRDNYLYDMNKLLVPAEYHAEIHPKASAEEEAARKAEAEAKAAKEAAKKEAAAKKAAEAKAAPAVEPAVESAGADSAAPADASGDDREARIAAAKARAAEAKAKREAAKAAGGETTAAPAEKAEDPDREARIAAAKARAAEAKAKREASRAAEAAGDAPAGETVAEPIAAMPADEPVAAPAEDREARIAAAKARAAEAKAKREANRAAEAAGEVVTAEPVQSAEKKVDPEREARIAAAKARAAEAKAKREAEKARAEALAPASEIVPEDLVLETLVPEMESDSVPVNDQTVETVESITGVDKQGQTTTKESDTMSEQNEAKASIQSGAEESEAIANNDPVFTDPAPAGEIGQQPDIEPSQGEQAVESPPPSSESNLTPDTVTAGDEKAAQKSEPAPTSGTAAEENVPLPAAVLEAPVGGEHAAASAQSAAKAEALEQADEDHDQAKASEST